MSAAEKDSPEKSVQDFLQRWSRRRLGIAEAEDAAPPLPEPPQTGESQSVRPPAEASAQPQTPFDLESLPPLESIDATTDIRAFLAPGVPVELTRAALRRAWTSDPVIRDFVGIAENQWDFTNPDAIPGFGSLELGDEVRAMVSRLFGETPAEPPPKPATTDDVPADRNKPETKPETMHSDEPDRASASASVAVKGTVPDSDTDDHAALQNQHGREERRFTPRKHGAALPK